MRIAFLGYGMLGATVLRGVADRHEVKLVVTHRPSFGGLNEPDVADAAAHLGLPMIFSTTAGEPHVRELVKDAAVDVIVSTNWRTRLPAGLLEIPALGAVNVHDALLPRYAGFGAVNWAIRNGETQTGLTVHFMDPELDTGPILTQQIVKIGPHDTAGQVLETLVAQYVPVTLRALDLVAAGHRGTPQDLREASFHHRITEQDTRIDWSLSTTSLHNLVRGQSDPFVNAWTTYNGLRIAILAAAPPVRAYPGTPGRLIRAAEGGVAIACGHPERTDGRGLILLRIRPEDQPPIPATDYFRTFGGYLT
jgi:methionyl-tRNA formyltransferase